MSKNEKIIGDDIHYRRFAYLHKGENQKDQGRFGLLEAVDSKDARRYLGSSYKVKQVWLSWDEQVACLRYDRDLVWDIVTSVFNGTRTIQ